VYVELEAIALSRDIPLAVRFVADPIVRRVSRNSLLISLQQTEDAMRHAFVAQAGAAGSSSAAGQTRKNPALISPGISAFVGNR
jgi:hypothetical protein